MAGGRIKTLDRARWNHTSAVLSMIFNMHRGPDTQARDADYFHPYENDATEKPAAAAPKVGIGILKQVFVDRQLP